MQLPEEWTYEIQTEKQDTVYGIRFYWGEDKENKVLVKYEKDYPGEECGTGLEEKKIRLAGEKALEESRDGFESGLWEEIVFLGEKSDIHIINQCGEIVWWKENEKQVMQILLDFPAHQAFFKQKVLCPLRGNQIILSHTFLLTLYRATTIL